MSDTSTDFNNFSTEIEFDEFSSFDQGFLEQGQADGFEVEDDLFQNFDEENTFFDETNIKKTQPKIEEEVFKDFFSTQLGTEESCQEPTQLSIDLDLTFEDYLYHPSENSFDLWLSLVQNEDLAELQLNNKNRLKWAHSKMKDKLLEALGVEVVKEAKLTPKKESLLGDKLSYSMKDVATVARRLDTTLANALGNVSLETMQGYSYSDLLLLRNQVLEMVDEIALAMEHWRSQDQLHQHSTQVYNQMIANLVAHTHKPTSNSKNKKLPQHKSTSSIP